MALIRDMLSYWKRPVFTVQIQRLDTDALIELGKLLAFCLGGVFAIFIAIGLLFQILSVEPPQMSEAADELAMSPVFPLLAIIIVPAIEEVIFRSWLGIKWGVMLILPILLWGVACIVFLQEKTLSSELDFAIMVGLSALIFVYVVQYCRMASEPVQQDKALQRVFPFIFWATALFFGTIHGTNFAATDLGLLALIVTLPQIFVGGVLGFLRIRFGLLVAIGFHGAYNGVLLLLSTLAMQSMPAGEGVIIKGLFLLF